MAAGGTGPLIPPQVQGHDGRWDGMSVTVGSGGTPSLLEIRKPRFCERMKLVAMVGGEARVRSRVCPPQTPSSPHPSTVRVVRVGQLSPSCLTAAQRRT